MRKLTRSIVAITLAATVSGCLGTIVTAPTGEGKTYGATSVRIVASPDVIDARDCANGLSEVTVAIPLWGVVVGILTLGIVVPMNTTFTCAT